MLFSTVQNKLHYAIHGQTAAEVIVDRADHQTQHMALRKIQMTMQDWETRLNKFIKAMDREILQDDWG